MVRHVDAIYTGGTFRPLAPLALPEGTRVHLSVEDAYVEDETDVSPARLTAKVHTPKLAHPEDAADFAMEVRENHDAGV